MGPLEVHVGINDNFINKNTYSLEKDGKKHVLLPLKDEVVQEDSGSNILLMTGKELLQEIKKGEELHFALIGKTKGNFDFHKFR